MNSTPAKLCQFCYRNLSRKSSDLAKDWTYLTFPGKAIYALPLDWVESNSLKKLEEMHFVLTHETDKTLFIKLACKYAMNSREPIFCNGECFD